MKTQEQVAKDLANNIYQSLGTLNVNETTTNMWEWAKERAKEQVWLIIESLSTDRKQLAYWEEVEQAITNLP